MSTPTEAVSETIIYLIICFIGIPFITAYNIISSIFRGLGDSKSPMYFIAIACVVNIILDYLFIGGLHLGAAGAALGTTLLQTVSVIVALCVVLRRKTGITLKRQYFKPHMETMGQILRIGIPVALQEGFIQIAFIVITVIANRRGLNDAAAVGIVEKFISISDLIFGIAYLRAFISVLVDISVLMACPASHFYIMYCRLSVCVFLELTLHHYIILIHCIRWDLLHREDHCSLLSYVLLPFAL